MGVWCGAGQGEDGADQGQGRGVESGCVPAGTTCGAVQLPVGGAGPEYQETQGGQQVPSEGGCRDTDEADIGGAEGAAVLPSLSGATGPLEVEPQQGYANGGQQDQALSYSVIGRGG